MTSTEQINELIYSGTELKSYFEGIRGRIDSDLNMAERRVGDTFRQFHVDAVNGDDSADGSEATPLKTMQEASDRSVWGGYLLISLMSDYLMDRTISFRCGGVHITTNDENINRRISFADHLDYEDSLTNPRFAFPFTGGGSFHFKGITFVSRKMSADIARPHMIATHGLTVTVLNRCEFEVPDGANLPIFQQAHGLGFTVSNSVYPPEMAGLWIENAAAGTDPATVRNLAFTNLTSL